MIKSLAMCVVLSAGLAVVRPLAAQAEDAGVVLDRASAAYDSTRTLTADFMQVVTNPMIGEPDTTYGRLSQQRPNFFEMLFRLPRGDRIVADGRYLWLYTPSTTPGQVIRTPIPNVGTTGPNLIGQFVDHARERYRATYVRSDTLSGSDGLADVIALEPIVADLPYRSAVIWVARRDSLVRRLDITESSGQLRTVVLHAIQVNSAISSRAFAFSVPRGVHVVSQ